MGIAIIMGIQESSRDAIMEVLMEDRAFPKFEYTSLDTPELPVRDMKKYLDGFNRDIKRFVTENLKSQRTNIIINVPVTIEMQQGLVPVLAEDFFEIVKPEVLILVEETPEPARMKSEDRRKISMQQEINREHAARYSSESGCPLKIIKVKPAGVKVAIREVKQAIMPAFS